MVVNVAFQILIPTSFGEEKIFVEVSGPLTYQDFITAVIAGFNLQTDCAELELYVNKFKVKESQFSALIEQYCQSVDFFIDVKIRETEDSTYSTASCSSNASGSSAPKIGENQNSEERQLYVTELRTTIPSKDCIQELPQIAHIYQKFNNGIPLQNKERVKISKAIIDECLTPDPQIVLSRKDFQQLATIVKQIFPGEVESAYFIPSSSGSQSRGKLWSAYNNKRTALSECGIIQRRAKVPRRTDTDELIIFESIEFLEESIYDWPTTLEKWAQTHTHRRNELKSNIATVDYILKYPSLQNVNAIDLASIDVKTLYPSVSNIDSLHHKYKKLLDRAHNLRDTKVTELLADINSSPDESYKAGLSLLLIPFILPHCGKKVNAKQATKRDIQDDFIKEYPTISELNNEENVELLVAFVRENHQFTLAEFRCAGFKYKCIDLLQAVNTAFMFMIALDLKYPKLCKHVWQFIQLAIYEIELPLDDKVPCVESAVNDIFKKI